MGSDKPGQLQVQKAKLPTCHVYDTMSKLNSKCRIRAISRQLVNFIFVQISFPRSKLTSQDMTGRCSTTARLRHKQSRLLLPVPPVFPPAYLSSPPLKFDELPDK